MPLTLVRRPKPSTVQHKEIIDQVGAELKSIADDSIDTLNADVADWETKPEFKLDIHIGKRVWRIRVYVDRRTKSGKIYTWVDEGTGERGGGKAYVIRPKKKRLLSFHVPYKPKTAPRKVSGKAVPNYGPVNVGPPADLLLGKVHAKGIRPRNFTESLRADLKDRKNVDGIKMRIDAAIKRGLYRIGREGGVRVYTRRK